VDDAKNELSRFEVHRTPDGRWVVPSHGDYPADATAQMAEAANVLINLPIIGVASEVATDQELFGVVEPTQKRLDEGDKGFGIMVGMQDKKGNDLAKIVIGKKVANTENHHFVRKVGQDVVYVVAIDTSKLSTNFGDWIEKDLLKINPWDIDRVSIKDYQLVVKPTEDGSISIGVDPRMDLTVGLEEGGSSWVVDKFTQYVKQKPVSSTLSADEELNKEALDTLKSAVDSLQIVDVEAKPKGLGSAALAEEEIKPEQLGIAMNNLEIRAKLQEVGFLPAPRNNRYEWKGANGEMTVGTKDGVEYVLRFGNSRETEAGKTKAGGVKARRYLFVTARLDETRLKPPALEALPDANVPAPEPKEEDAKKDPAADAAGIDKGCQDEAGKPADDEKEPDDKSEDKKPDDKKPSTTDFDLKRKQIEKENQRKIDTYNESKRKAEAKVRELNARFAPWYYIVSDDEFHKIHLTKAEVIRERTGPGVEGTGIDAFRELERGGIDKPPAPPAGSPGRGGLPPGIPNFGN
jgi:hypothetical protein